MTEGCGGSLVSPSCCRCRRGQSSPSRVITTIPSVLAEALLLLLLLLPLLLLLLLSLMTMLLLLHLFNLAAVDDSRVLSSTLFVKSSDPARLPRQKGAIVWYYFCSWCHPHASLDVSLGYQAAAYRNCVLEDKSMETYVSAPLSVVWNADCYDFGKGSWESERGFWYRNVLRSCTRFSNAR